MNPMVPQPVRVERVQKETGDVVTLTLDTSARGFEFAPGQFNMLYAFAVGEVPISMSGDPERREVLVHTVRTVGAVSEALCRLRKGSVVGVRGPYGHPWPMAQLRGADLLIIAGGVGLAPLRPVIYHVLHHRADYGRVSLLTGARAPENLLFRKELARWQERGDIQVLVTVDHATPEWTGRVGVVPALLAEAAFDPSRAAALICGPEVMMRFTVRDLAQRGIPDERIYVSMERNMKCAVGLCGHCQYGASFVCKDGPVFRFDGIRARFWLREV